MGCVVNATLRPPYPRERIGTHCIGGWVGPRAGLDGCGKSRLPPGFVPRTVQAVASLYADRAIPAPARMQPKVFYLWDSPTPSKIKHPSCTNAKFH